MLTITYAERNAIREQKINEATEGLVDFFIERGDSDAIAKEKVSELSTEVALWIYPYILGNTKPLINAINESELDFMSAAAKAFLVDALSF